MPKARSPGGRCTGSRRRRHSDGVPGFPRDDAQAGWNHLHDPADVAAVVALVVDDVVARAIGRPSSVSIIAGTQ